MSAAQITVRVFFICCGPLHVNARLELAGYRVRLTNQTTVLAVECKDRGKGPVKVIGGNVVGAGLPAIGPAQPTC
ncbi:hypothetical protein D3C81_2101430 [compost metagenome]